MLGAYEGKLRVKHFKMKIAPHHFCCMGVGYLVELLVLLLAVCAADQCTWTTFRGNKNCTPLIIGGDASGSIPPEIRDMTGLSHLTLQNTGLTGTIPADLFDGALRNTLSVLNFTNNPFIMGPIPDAMSSLSALRILDISNTPLQGTIPRSFGSCNSLTRWSINNVPLTGIYFTIVFIWYTYALS